MPRRHITQRAAQKLFLGACGSSCSKPQHRLRSQHTAPTRLPQERQGFHNTTTKSPTHANQLASTHATQGPRVPCRKRCTRQASCENQKAKVKKNSRGCTLPEAMHNEPLGLHAPRGCAALQRLWGCTLPEAALRTLEPSRTRACSNLFKDTCRKLYPTATTP